MLFVSKPTQATIRSLLAERDAASFSYSYVGATRGVPPAGWRINHMRALLGTGRAKFGAAIDALFSWKLLASDDLQVFPSTEKLQQGTNVAILSRHFGIWSLDFCRVIYILKDEPEQDGRVLRSGFAYGTLPGHAVRGEEIFSIEWRPARQEVWYDIYSFSLPATAFVRLIAPIARATQQRFGRGSLDEAARIASTIQSAE